MLVFTFQFFFRNALPDSIHFRARNEDWLRDARWNRTETSAQSYWAAVVVASWLCTFFGREYSVNKSSMCQPNKQNIQFFFSLSFLLFLSAVDEFIGYSRSVLQAKCKRVLFFLCTFILYTCISVCWMCRSLVGWSGIQHIFENRMLNKLLVCQNKSISFATSIQFHSTITFLYLYMFHCDPVSKTLSISRYISFSLLSFKSASTPCI